MSVLPYLTSLGGGPTVVEGPMGIGRAALLADWMRAGEVPWVVVVSDEDEARRLRDELSFFLGLPEQAPDFLPERKILLLLGDDRTPYDSAKLAPDKTRQMETLAALYALTQPFRPALTITTASAFVTRVPPKPALLDATTYLLAGAEFFRQDLLRTLAQNGYTQVPLVEDPGTMSVRGALLDVYSPLYRWPLRLEFIGDTLESIRLFDHTTQKSLRKLEDAYLTPVKPIFLEPAARKRAAKSIEQAARGAGRFDRRLQTVLLDLEEGLYSTELLPYAPLFYEEMPPLLAYFSSQTRLVLDDPAGIDRETNAKREQFRKLFAERLHDDDLALPPERYLAEADDLTSRLAHQPPRRIERLPLGGLSALPPDTPRFVFDDHAGLREELAAKRGQSEILEPLLRRLRGWLDEGWRIFLIAHTDMQLVRMDELLAPRHIRGVKWDKPFPEIFAASTKLAAGQVYYVVGAIKTGQIWPSERVVFLCEEEIFGERKRRAVKTVAFDKDAFLTSLDELNEGDFIVHAEFGIGVYRGLKHLKVGGSEGDFLQLEYAGRDALYLPITRLEKVQKYSGAEGQVPRLDKLGTNRWAQVKGKIKAAIMEMANELITLYAQRQVAEGFAFSAPDGYYREFEAAFPYEETPDQARAIEDVLGDMQRIKPMDRLVCGDVGFGKTEVAIRAAFKAVLDNKQVAVLVPTTILALQHGETFASRLKNYPVRIGVLSRFKSAAEQKELIQQAKSGFVDILVGTHRLLAKDVRFANLGLLIVDEEHRFGVAHKERIKQVRAKVDVLTLTATPIPRTLNMAFLGVRDISVIRTPPTDRLSVRTFVSAFDEDVIREAVSNELQRGGQVYFVHNRIGSIEAMATMIKNLVPQARVVTAHGQMGEEELEEIMLGFMHKHTNVLVSTTIIESGIDIPSVNTMIVNRADTFGLAQLYQLRGRVGRGSQRAYAYLLVPSPNALTKDAQKRLAVLMRYTELGSGFRIASHDLEIRGAGNLLGKQQSGHITCVGIDLYLEMIEEAARELKGEKPDNDLEPQVNLYLPAYLPEPYIEDAALRLHFYKRLSAARDTESLFALADEIEDRFGRLPDEGKGLVAAIELKILLRDLGIAGLDLLPDRMTLHLGQACLLTPESLVELVALPNSLYALSPDLKLSRRFVHHEMGDPLGTAKFLLQKLGECGRKRDAS